ncbi:hypothetical protein P7C73_g3600, partial [Tremellales sp. Uapishka_1]
MSKTTSFKLVLLGESAVGKSSLVLRFRIDHWWYVDSFDSHPTSDRSVAAFLTQTVTLDESSAIKFEIWDTAGQERYKSLAPIYFRNSNAAVIVYDITQASPPSGGDCSPLTIPKPPDTSFEKAKSWVRELQRQADPSIVIMLVGNKSDLESARKTPRVLGARFAEEEGLLFAEASAKSGDGVEDLFMEIARKLPLAPPVQKTAAAGRGVKVSGQPEAATPSACTC